MAASGIVTANSTFFFGEFGHLIAGTPYSADDPLVKEHPDWFTAIEESGFLATTVKPVKPAPVEQATSSPGEKRTTKRASSS